MANRATTELVTVAFIKSMTGILTSQVATQLPDDNSTWSASGFVKCGPVVGGSPMMYVPIRYPVIEINTFAVNPNTENPNWGKAESLANLIVEGTYDMALTSKALTLKTGYNQAIVNSAVALTEPTRIEGDPSNYARYSFDMQIMWKEIL